MNSKLQDDERRHFSDRLKGALLAVGLGSSAAKFAAQFNLRADGSSVTAHGARKWLVGDAIPTQARIQILADWLGVSAAWLRFGDAENSDIHSGASLARDLQTTELILLHDVRRLSESNRKLVRAMVDQILRNELEEEGRPHPMRTKKP